MGQSESRHPHANTMTAAVLHIFLIATIIVQTTICNPVNLGADVNSVDSIQRLTRSKRTVGNIFERLIKGLVDGYEEIAENPAELILEDLVENVAEHVIEEMVVLDPFNEVDDDDE